MANVIAVFALILAWGGGWIAGHVTIARECEKLGGFYVGKNVYHCTKIAPAPTVEKD